MIQTFEQYLQYREKEWKDYLASCASNHLSVQVEVPDLRMGGFVKIPLGENRAGFFNVQSLDEFLGNANTILNLAKRREIVRQEDVEKIARGMRRSNPWEALEKDVKGIYEFLQKRIAGVPIEVRNELIADYLLRRLDIGENFGVRLFGDSKEFIFHLNDMLKNSEFFRENYSIGDVSTNRKFTMKCNLSSLSGRGCVSFKSHSYEPENQVDSSYHGAPIICAHWLNDMKRFMDNEEIPGRFAMVKGDEPNSSILSGVFYDPKRNYA